MTAICQKTLPFAPWMQEVSRRLPGVQPVDMADWLQVDDAYAAQMARRRDLLAERREDVLQLSTDAWAAAIELLDLVLGVLPDLGFEVGAEVTCPDGHVVRVDRDDPLGCLGQIVQEDFCLLQNHILTGAVLCFPASWSLAEKFGRNLNAIHEPVPDYDTQIGKRVGRLFDAIQPGRVLMRANALRYSDPELFHPHKHSDTGREGGAGDFIRSERQCLLRLPESGAVVFSIHTYQLREQDLSPERRDGLRAHPIVSAYEEFQ